MIEKLIEEGITFSVCVSRVYGVKISNLYSALDYCLICNNKHHERLKELKKDDGNFCFHKIGYGKVCHNMRHYEIRDFKAKQNLFKKVLHCEHGRVYELK